MWGGRCLCRSEQQHSTKLNTISSGRPLERSRKIREAKESKPAGLPSSAPTRQTTTTRAKHARVTNPPSSTAMQSPTPASYTVRLSGALAALLGRSEGAELPEDELLGWLREGGLITYPSPMLKGLLGGELPAVLVAKVLPRLDATDLAMFGRVGPASRAAVVASGLPRAGTNGRAGLPRLRLKPFCGSVKRLAWARENECPLVPRTCGCGRMTCGCSWDMQVCHNAAASGNLEVLIWAREHGCPWEEEEPDEYDGHMWYIQCCALAAKGGHLEVLKWLWKHDCPWDEWTCACAAAGGHLQLLKWARQHGCPWDEDIRNTHSPQDCAALAARGGHLEVLKWLWQNDCPGFHSLTAPYTCACAAASGHLDVLKWLREHNFAWDARTVQMASAARHNDVLQWALANGCPS